MNMKFKILEHYDFEDGKIRFVDFHITPDLNVYYLQNNGVQIELNWLIFGIAISFFKDYDIS